jgi:uncharacterized protein (UPF0264 family)
MTQLLVSVRSAAEAEAALAGGAALLDVKEPAHGPLGRAGDATIADVVGAVAGRRPVSAALGELLGASQAGLPPVVSRLAYVKWGLAGYRARRPARWKADLAHALGRTAAPCRGVVVAYADWRRAPAPPPEEVCAFAREHAAGAFLLDTWGKDGTTLLNWLPLPDVCRLCERCRAAGVPVALAGSLGPAQVRTLRAAGPDWFAVRGAVCQGGRPARAGAVDQDKVRQLVELLAEPLTPAMRAS